MVVTSGERSAGDVVFAGIDFGRFQFMSMLSTQNANVTTTSQQADLASIAKEIHNISMIYKATKQLIHDGLKLLPYGKDILRDAAEVAVPGLAAAELGNLALKGIAKIHTGDVSAKAAPVQAGTPPAILPNPLALTRKL